MSVSHTCSRSPLSPRRLLLFSTLCSICLSCGDAEVDEDTAAGVRYFVAGDLSAALQALRTAESAGGNHYVTYSYLARTLLGLGKYGEAHDAIEKALSLAPRRADLHEIHGSIHAARYTARAWTEIQEQDAEDAIAAYRDAIELDPERASPHYNLGVMHGYRDSTRLAEHAFRAALSVDSTMAQAHKKLGRILRHRGLAEEAATSFAKATSFAPTDAEALYRLGLAYRDLGRYEEAAEVTERAVELNPYAGASHLLITADAGGSNGPKTRLWKWELQRFANRTGLTITVCHYPPGTSKWNKIEHRLFSHIAMNWRGKALTSLAAFPHPPKMAFSARPVDPEWINPIGRGSDEGRQERRIRAEQRRKGHRTGRIRPVGNEAGMMWGTPKPFENKRG